MTDTRTTQQQLAERQEQLREMQALVDQLESRIANATFALEGRAAPLATVEDAAAALVVAMKERGLRAIWLDAEGHITYVPGPDVKCTGCDGSGWISGPMNSPYIACQVCKRQVKDER